MNANGEPASLASYLRAFGYDAEDVAGCVRVQLAPRRGLSARRGVTIECESDRFRFTRDIRSPSFLGLLWMSWLFGVVVPLVSVGYRLVPLTAALPFAFWLPFMAMFIVDELRTESATNNLRLLVASYATVAQPAVTADEPFGAPLNA